MQCVNINKYVGLNRTQQKKNNPFRNKTSFDVLKAAMAAEKASNEHDPSITRSLIEHVSFIILA